VTITSISSQQPIIAIVGPTASGKSDLGIAMALRFGGEIINCDSVQVYREIDVATAKVPFNMRRGVPHHLIDFVPPDDNYTAGRWARDALLKIEEIEARGSIAMIVGGTGFYLRALRSPFFLSPPTDRRLRRRFTRLRERHGPEHLHRMLQRLDPRSAARFFPRDWPRVQRALEVRLQTGQSLADLVGARKEPPECAARIRVLALLPPRQELYRRIDARTEAHFAAGLAREVCTLLNRGVPRGSNALGAHGYRRVVEFILGEREYESAVAQTKLDVRHYAKRQLTWFRREPGVEWFEGFGDDPLVQERVAARIAELIAGGSRPDETTDERG
jgi:tRNA dimethylallyltransferase